MIIIDHLTKLYDGFSLEVSLTVPKGRVTGLVGKNGAGKSTTIKAILGLVKPDSGSVRVFGKEAAALTGQDKQRLGVTFAESGFSGYLTVSAIVKILEQMYPVFDRAMFLTQCRKLGIPMNKPLKEFSTGMKAKVRVLAAISHKADLLILDEPTAGLDILARREILNLLREYMAEEPNRSILITSHISGDLEGLCDDIYMIGGGRVILHEDMAVLLKDYAVLRATEEQFRRMNREELLAVRKTAGGYACLTDKKDVWLEREPGLTAEGGSVDELMLMLMDEQEDAR